MEKMTEKFDIILDTRGLQCPLPVLKLRKILKTTNAGQIVKCLATDTASMKDVADFCESAGHVLHSQTQAQDETGQNILVHYIEKGNH